MKLKKIINNYLEDTEYKIIIKNNLLNIVNYQEIIDFNSNEIIIKTSNNKIILKGNNLLIKKMCDNELSISGTILNILIN